ncbi:hypothetical protein NCCP2716_29100 [Sporosarcina sp. NCCP-2716]|uniref:DUF4288 domain-containing protein n=1 Tax=Sporosarcina sp. NCCP-2716 TaxID=2943679 RepID=UPI00203B5F39|nr:DUF4288 domain-containing protein [Sporosarcina sp. NCCP-2716]GKV70412.1 hypothetical protein NCCP2716_29100 [Sporosarcina sp. NCCP-2716]
MGIYSVKLLLESTVRPNMRASKTFEESIVLVKVKNPSEIQQKIYGHFVDVTYENADRGQTTWSLVKILDTFELMDDFEGNIDFKEVYSRYLPFDKPMTADQVIDLYSLEK